MSYIYDENDDNNTQKSQHDIMTQLTEKDQQVEEEDGEIIVNTTTNTVVVVEEDYERDRKTASQSSQTESECDIENEDFYTEYCISSTLNPIKISLDKVSKRIKEKLYVNFQLIDIVTSLSTISSKEYDSYLFKEGERCLPETNEEWKIHRSNLVEALKSNAYDLIFLNIPGKKQNRYSNVTQEKLSMYNVVVLSPSVVTESTINCPEGDFINHKIMYEGRKPFEKEEISLTIDQTEIEIRFEFYDKTLLEFTKPYHLRFMLYL